MLPFMFQQTNQSDILSSNCVLYIRACVCVCCCCARVCVGGEGLLNILSLRFHRTFSTNVSFRYLSMVFFILAVFPSLHSDLPDLCISATFKWPHLTIGTPWAWDHLTHDWEWIDVFKSRLWGFTCSEDLD